jgi:phosphate transport system substrate-binding protein
VKLSRAALAVGVLATTVALAACSSSSSPGGNDTSAPPATTPAAGTSVAASASTGTGSGAAPTCSTGTLTGEGSSAQANAMTAWINAYTKACSGSKINYNPSGSGAGVSDFNANQIDFGGSDAALNAAAGEVKGAQARCGSAPLDLPMVIGPVAVAFNVSGVQSLNLTPTLIAQIFTGKIKTWDDAAIAKENSGVKLPSSAINVIYRSDASGTTANFENYLATTDPTDFTATPAKDNAQKVFAGVGKTASSGVAAALKSTTNSIGYVEYSYAVQGSLATAAIDSGAGPVQISSANASIAAASATVVGKGDDLSLDINYKTTAKNAYPLILATYEIACTKYKNATTGTYVKNFLNYTATGGQAALPQLGYAPLPASLQTKVLASIAKIS